MNNKLLHAFLFFIAFVIIAKFFCSWSNDKEDFTVYGNGYYYRPNCFRNVFGEKVCYPNRYGYPYYYYPYVRADSTYIRRRPRYWGGTNRAHYWRRY